MIGIYVQPRGYYGDLRCPICRDLIHMAEQRRMVEVLAGFYWQPAVAHRDCKIVHEERNRNG